MRNRIFLAHYDVTNVVSELCELEDSIAATWADAAAGRYLSIGTRKSLAADLSYLVDALVLPADVVSNHRRAGLPDDAERAAMYCQESLRFASNWANNTAIEARRLARRTGLTATALLKEHMKSVPNTLAALRTAIVMFEEVLRIAEQEKE